MSNFSTKKVFTGNRIVGEVSAGIFHKRIKGSKHILHTPRSIALSVESLEQAEQFGAGEIQITDVETGCNYSCTVEHFRKNSLPIQRGGFEPQLALALERFDVSSLLEISSHAPKPGEVKRKPGNGERVRNERGVSKVSPRQLLFKGMI